VIESCRRLDVPIRDYQASVLSGLANRSIQSIAQLTPAAFAAHKLK
jgi:transposase